MYKQHVHLPPISVADLPQDVQSESTALLTRIQKGKTKKTEIAC